MVARVSESGPLPIITRLEKALREKSINPKPFLERIAYFVREGEGGPPRRPKLRADGAGEAPDSIPTRLVPIDERLPLLASLPEGRFLPAFILSLENTYDSTYLNLALSRSARKGHAHYVSLLLAKGIGDRPGQISNKSAKVALENAAKSGHIKIVKMLLTLSIGDSPRHLSKSTQL